ncbi:DUF6412 domain-containing protein [Streptomyces gardneri]|uniref:Uncharacterized protein n=1 Tax=Streptomyces gardneri TaxID=66892 RepID=A0A4Y3RTP6_9ACTN|nr:DUF6412 domain-containing protein [Streptomyces gardneri]ALO08657.1 hypothetical protein AQF52_3063 [Streptomyces venezuelae]QPK45851.1 hypothetical protein H4W23_15210 [Streptomyces gardneri]WRK37202.1 DUF6412 domain-containing protein [Streptomyces venezuelae]GEB59280.1 hypothetical protein SGA01_48850 [Streptomyces gardneri]GHG80985.1 hypothetical protein GCM10017674_01370 [Streptomyces gardneri]
MTVRSLLLRVLAPLFFLLALAGLLLSDGAGLAAVVLAATTVVCALIGAPTAPAVPATRVRTAIRDRERRTAFLPQRDPDAAGRRRPRAPGGPLLTAA